MIVNIAPSTKRVSVDGVNIKVNYSPELDPSIQGIFWSNTEGNVAYYDPVTKLMTANEVITDFSPYQYIVDAFYVAIEEAKAAAEKQKEDSVWEMALLKRKIYLSNSDWTQLPDVDLTPEEKAAWSTYRQALRDVPSQLGFPKDIVWPTEPL